jgi:hypothetical protein
MNYYVKDDFILLSNSQYESFGGEPSNVQGRSLRFAIIFSCVFFFFAKVAGAPVNCFDAFAFILHPSIATSSLLT